MLSARVKESNDARDSSRLAVGFRLIFFSRLVTAARAKTLLTVNEADHPINRWLIGHSTGQISQSDRKHPHVQVN
jgi:hypothetical protein